jgi:hypothetical protein
MSQRFRAEIFRVGINPCVDVPQEVSAALGRKRYIPVVGTLNGAPFRSGLVSLGGGRHRLFIDTEMRRDAGVDVGDRAEMVLEYDPEPRIEPAPEQLTRSLEANPAAREAWEGLTPSRRKEILRYLNSLKRPESLHRNVEKVIQELLDHD